MAEETPRGNAPPVHFNRPTQYEWLCHACGVKNSLRSKDCQNCMEPRRKEKVPDADD